MNTHSNNFYTGMVENSFDQEEEEADNTQSSRVELDIDNHLNINRNINANMGPDLELTPNHTYGSESVEHQHFDIGERLDVVESQLFDTDQIVSESKIPLRTQSMVRLECEGTEIELDSENQGHTNTSDRELVENYDRVYQDTS